MRTVFFFFSSRRRHTRCGRDWSSDVCSSDLSSRRSGLAGCGWHSSSTTCNSGRCCRSTNRKCRACCTRGAMATENSNYDALRNPQVDFDRTDLSPRGILLFLIGLLLCGVFIELILWGMFRFMAKSEVLFPQAQANPMMSAQKQPPAPNPRSILQNAPAVDTAIFPEPRLQVNDVDDMSKSLASEQELLNPPQPFKDANGAIHIPISQAMKLIEERGLPVRPNAPAAANPAP